MRKILAIILLSLIFGVFAFGQTDASPSSDPAPAKTISPTKIDEFGNLGECEFTGRLDNFFIELHNDPDLTGYVMIYVGKDMLPSQRNFTSRRKLIDNHIAFRKFDASRVVFINGGFRESNTYELWVVPPGYPAPEPADTVEPPQTPENETYLYDKGYLGSEEYGFGDKFLLQSVIDQRRKDDEEREAELAEESEGEDIRPAEAATDVPALEEADGEEIEPEEEFEPYVTPEEETYTWLNTIFLDKVMEKKKTRGVLVFYLDDETYDKQKVRDYIERAIEHNKKDREVFDRGRLKIVFGGYRNGLEIEMWVMPKGGKMPKLKPEERPKEEPETIDN